MRKVNYPNKQVNSYKPHNQKTLGMLFENELNISNEYYRYKNIAYIYKKPTPIQVVKVDYPKREKARIIEAYYRTPSTTDYNGIYKGRYIDYEAKETNNLSFYFKHIFTHQIDHLKAIDKLGGIGFIIIYFKKLNEVYIIDIKDFIYQIELGKKAIKASEIIDLGGKKVKIGSIPMINYLESVDELYFKKIN